MALVVALLISLSCATPMLAQTDAPNTPATPAMEANMQISATWDGGDMLTLDIIDLDTMERHQVAIRLSDFIGMGDNAAYILLQAMDLSGERQSEVIQIENPLHKSAHAGEPSYVYAVSGQSGDANSGNNQLNVNSAFNQSNASYGSNQSVVNAADNSNSGQTVADSGSSIDIDDLPENLQEIIAGQNQPNQPEPPTLTPEGTGTVVDNIMTINDIEFFTVTTEGGNDFFLVIDRQRATDNVYLLNMVTEADLMALAEARDETQPSTTGDSSMGAVQQPEPAPTLTMEEILLAIQESNEQSQSTPTPAPTQQGNNSGIVILIVIVLLLGGGGFLAWKYLLPKLLNAGQRNQDDSDDEDLDDVYYDDGDDYSANFEAVEVDDDEDEDGDEDGASCSHEGNSDEDDSFESDSEDE